MKQLIIAALICLPVVPAQAAPTKLMMKCASINNRVGQGTAAVLKYDFDAQTYLLQVQHLSQSGAVISGSEKAALQKGVQRVGAPKLYVSKSFALQRNGTVSPSAETNGQILIKATKENVDLKCESYR